MRAQATPVVRAARVAAGAVLLFAGAALLVLPGPGIPLVLAALLLLQTEFPWARRLRARLSGAAGRSGPLLRRAWTWVVHRAAFGLALLPVLTDWLDTGHWPQRPRELVTEVIVGVVIFLGVWHLHLRAERFRTLSRTDPLTGIGNRAQFRADLDAAIAGVPDEPRGVAVGIIDVDRFKGVNDAFGHAAGDEVLREVGVALSRSVRQGVDGVYRLGGDEFAVLVRGAGAQQVLHALRRGFDSASNARSAPVSCSIGIVAHLEGESVDALVHRADAFMYAAKNGDTADGAHIHAFGRVKLGRAVHV